MRDKIILRMHHIYDFVKALMSDDFREKQYLRVDKKFGGDTEKGFCYSKEEVGYMRDLLSSVSDDTVVNIIRGMDEICQICTSESKSEKASICLNIDPLRNCYKLLGYANLERRVTIGFLKERYLIYNKFGSIKKWKNKKKKWKRASKRKAAKAEVPGRFFQ